MRKAVALGKKYALLAVCAMALAGCGRDIDMRSDARIKPYGESAFFEDRSSARALPENAVAREDFFADPSFYTGKRGNEAVDEVPLEASSSLLERGAERYGIFCAICHDAAGTGQGMMVKKGFVKPPSYHIDRLRRSPIGHFVDVIANGYITMPEHGSLVGPRDRWAIALYVRALQMSQNAVFSDVPQDKRRRLLD